MKKTKSFFNKITGFTLAETLITLAIIGVIAALTIPNLYQKYQKKEMETRFVQFYSIMTNALKMYMADNGCSDLACAGWVGENTATEVGTFGSGSIIPVAKDFSSRYLKAVNVKNFAPIWSYEYGKYKALDGGIPGFWTRDGDVVCETAVCAKLPNDIRIGFPANGSGGCSPAVSSVHYCSKLNVDLNGNKGPNRYGYDVFFFQVMSDGTLLNRDWSTECASPKEASGRRQGIGCAGRVVKNGRKIDYWD